MLLLMRGERELLISFSLYPLSVSIINHSWENDLIKDLVDIIYKRKEPVPEQDRLLDRLRKQRY
jgi:hypothetical protein